MDLKSIISKKAHETSVKSLENVPPSIKEYLTVEFLESIASALSAITRDHFNYTGKILKEKESLRITFTSSSQTDTIDMIISYADAGFEFVNINQKLEKALDDNIDVITKAPEVITVIAPETIEVVEPPKQEEKPVAIPMNVLTQMLADEKKDETSKMANAVMLALQQMNVQEQFKKKSAQLDELIKEND